MKKMIFFLLFLGALSFNALFPANTTASGAGPLPTVIVTRPPVAVVIPNTRYVYLLPDFEENILFYHGFWYRPYKESWYRSKGYNGPWKRLQKPPDAIMNLPVDFRRIPPGQERIPHKILKKNWRVWEEGRYWDKKAQKARHKEKNKARKKVEEGAKEAPGERLQEAPKEAPREAPEETPKEVENKTATDVKNASVPDQPSR